MAAVNLSDMGTPNEAEQATHDIVCVREQIAVSIVDDHHVQY